MRLKSIKRRQFIIDKPFQYGLIQRMITVVLLVNVLLYGINFYIYFKFNEYGESLSHQASEQFYLFFQDQVSILNKAFLICAIFTTCVLMLYGMFLSHRIAGPLFNLKMQLKRLKNSKNKEDLLNIPEAKFREHDFFHDLAHRYNEAIENVQNIIDEAENSNKKKDHDVVVPINSQKDKKVA